VHCEELKYSCQGSQVSACERGCVVPTEGFLDPAACLVTFDQGWRAARITVPMVGQLRLELQKHVLLIGHRRRAGEKTRLGRMWLKDAKAK
jgi:hypothetical protein